jgi:hypothetical protein
LEQWRAGAGRFARFDFGGTTRSIRDAYAWVFRAWMPRSRWRFAFATVVTLYDDAVWHATGFERCAARIFVPVERREPAGF